LFIRKIMIHYVYRTVNLITGSYYIGAHSSRKMNNLYLGSGLILSRAIKKYGKEKFKKEILEICESKEHKFQREAEIVTEETIKDPLCMNLKPGGHGGWISTKGKPHSEETKKKMSEIKKGTKLSEETKTKIRASSLKRKHSDETRIRMKVSHTGKIFSEEHKKNISENRKGKGTGKCPQKGHIPWNKGIKMSEEQKHYGQSFSEETRQKISKTQKERITNKRNCSLAC